MMSPKPTAGDDARTNPEAPITEKRSGSVDSWGPTESEVADGEIVMTDGGIITVSNGGSPDRFPELVAFHRDILLTLARSQPTNGQGLLADLSTLRDEHIYGSRLYRNLGELVDAGLVDKEEFPNDDRAHEFQLSASGQQAIRGHAQRLEGAVEALNESN